MSTFLGCIADDFTGATDLASLLARSGMQVSLRIGVPDEPAKKSAALEVIALKSRTAPVAEAVSDALKALDWLRAAGAERFFWKYCSTFDSTPQGNIGPVAEALMDALNVEQTIYCPAFPENGRAIFMGNLFVGEKPVAESPMKDHPLTPIQDSNLMRLLSPQVTRPVGLANRYCVARGADSLRGQLSQLALEGTAHVIVDAVTNDDLEVIAEACAHMKLMTGGSAVAMPLPGLWQACGLLPQDVKACAPRRVEGGAIVLSGSCSAMTRAQVAAFKALGGPSLRLDPLELAEQGPGRARQWLEAQGEQDTPIIYATAEPEVVRAAQDKLGVAKAGLIVEQALADLAKTARDCGRCSFIVAGGETAGAVTNALGIDRLDVGSEIAPGVPWCFAMSGGTAMAITLKSGNFGKESFFADALDMLRRMA